MSELADIDAKTAGTLAAFLRPVLSVGILLMIVRIVLSWYPQVNLLHVLCLALTFLQGLFEAGFTFVQGGPVSVAVPGSPISVSASK